MNPLPAPIQPIRLADLQAGLAGDVTSHSTSEASAPASVNGATKNGPVLPRQMFVFGNGDMGQHGLGTDVIDEIKRPRLHAWVASKNAEEKLGAGGLEMIAAGGMHTLAIDSTGKVSESHAQSAHTQRPC